MPIHDIKDTAVHALSAASAMGLFASRPRVLALGEPTHGEAMLLGARNELFRQLVEQQGYRTIAIESDCLRALIVNDYVATGTGSLDDVMARGFSHEWFNAAAANRELVGWMRAFNDGRDACDRVRFAGLDGPLEMAAAESPRRALIGLFGYLAAHVDARLLPCGVEELEGLAGDDDRWTNPAAMMDPAQSVGRSAEAARLRLLADDLLALLEENTPHLLAATSRDEFDRARLYARTALGLLRYHHAMADASPARMTRMVGLRGQMMAGNLLALPPTTPGARYSPTPTTPTSSGSAARCGWAGSRSSGGARARWRPRGSARGTGSWPRRSARCGIRGWACRRPTRLKGSCMRSRRSAVWWTCGGWRRASTVA